MAKSINLFKFLPVIALFIYSSTGSAGLIKPPCQNTDYGGAGIDQAVSLRGGNKTNGYISNQRLSYNGNNDTLKRALIKSIFVAELGVREESGRNDGNKVETYLQYTNLQKGNPWCAAFVCWVFGKAGIRNPRSAWSPDLFPADKVVWKRQVRVSNSSNEQPSNAFKTGNIFGIWFDDKKRIAHTGFIEDVKGSWIITVEGNTNEAGSREGDGVYRKRRLVSSLYQVADWISNSSLN